MTASWADSFLHTLKENDVRLVSYVPDNVLTPLIGGVTSDHPILTDPALDPWRPATVVVGGVLRDARERLGAK